MANTFTAPFAQTPQTGGAVATVASVITTSSPTNTLLLATAGADGAIFTKLTAIARSTVTASALYLFISQDAGTTKHLVDSALMAAYTLAATTDNEPTLFDLITETTPIRMKAGDELYVATGVALSAGIVFNGEWTDF